MVYTGRRAEQLMSGVIRMAIRRSFLFSIIRVAITAGIAQASPLIRGMAARPFIPTERIRRSVRKLIRAI
ncbi:hypothetical protein D3C80_1941320 [compost metagenome]